MWPYGKEKTTSGASTGDGTGVRSHVQERAAIDRGRVRALRATLRCYCVIGVQGAAANEQ